MPTTSNSGSRTVAPEKGTLRGSIDPKRGRRRQEEEKEAKRKGRSRTPSPKRDRKRGRSRTPTHRRYKGRGIPEIPKGDSESRRDLHEAGWLSGFLSRAYWWHSGLRWRCGLGCVRWLGTVFRSRGFGTRLCDRDLRVTIHISALSGFRGFQGFLVFSRTGSVPFTPKDWYGAFGPCGQLPQGRHFGKRCLQVSATH